MGLRAKVVSLAGACDSMALIRAYRTKVLNKGEAIEEIKRTTGTQFDPKVVDVFLEIADEI